MTEPRILARDLLVLRALADRVAAALTAAKTDTLAAMEVGERLVVKVGDTPVGTVTVAHGRPSARITDPRALLAWVKANHPTEVVPREEVRAAFVTALLGRAKSSGEVIPGIDVSQGDPYLLAPVDDVAAAVIGAAWADGSLSLPASVLPQIEGGDPDA
jgi:phage host-nuclease inhibitor protein Gam